MKKKFLFMALGVSMLGIMTGNFVKADDEVQEEESIVQPYEHQHRDVGESVYREAARAFAGGDGTENSPYEISSAEELQYLACLNIPIPEWASILSGELKYSTMPRARLRAS